MLSLPISSRVLWHLSALPSAAWVHVSRVAWPLVGLSLFPLPPVHPFP